MHHALAFHHILGVCSHVDHHRVVLRERRFEVGLLPLELLKDLLVHVLVRSEVLVLSWEAKVLQVHLLDEVELSELRIIVDLVWMLSLVLRKANHLENLGVGVVVSAEEPILLASEPSLAEGKHYKALLVELQSDVVGRLHEVSQEPRFDPQLLKNLGVRLDPRASPFTNGKELLVSVDVFLRWIDLEERDELRDARIQVHGRVAHTASDADLVLALPFELILAVIELLLADRCSGEVKSRVDVLHHALVLAY